MHRILLRILLAVWVSLQLPLGAQAQGTAARISQEVEDDRGFITRFLEERLSGAGRQVVLNGFQGALSSRATFTELIISDDDGAWITLRNGAIQWNRSALLARRIQINELSAETIVLSRLPGGGSQGPTAEATEFALPTLPVSVNIDRIKVDRVELGQPVIGAAAVIAIDGSMRLADGEGQAKLAINRVDGPRGQFALDTSFSNETRVLALDLTLDEDRDGLFANLIQLHDRPAVKAEIKGNGPLSDYAADITLATDGQPRITGNATIDAEERVGVAGTAFRLNVNGDVAALMPPQHKAFFSGTSQLTAEGWRGADGRILIPVLNVMTDALHMTGSATTTGNGAPQSIDVKVLLGEDAGAAVLPVLLPWADKPTTVRSGNLTLQFDAARGSGWVLRGRLNDVARDEGQLGELRLDGRGRISLTAGQALEEVRGWVAFGMDGIAPADAGLASAIGDNLNGGLNFALKPGEALALTGMNINGTEYGLTGDMTVSGLASGITLSGDTALTYGNLGRLSQLAGREIGGAAKAHIVGRYALLGKSFDANVEIVGQDIQIGQDHADRMLAGESRITVNARRDTSGIGLRELMVRAQNLTADAKGFVSSTSADVTATIDMPSLTVAAPNMAGAMRLDAQLTGPQNGRRLRVNGKAQGLVTGIPELDGALDGETALTVEATQRRGEFEIEKLELINPQLSGRGQGSFAPGALNAKVDFAFPNLAVLGRGFSGGLTATATATEKDGVRALDLTGQGTDLRLGHQNGDPGLAGVTLLRLSAQEQNGEITINDLKLDNALARADVRGSIGAARTDLSGTVDLRSLAAFGQGWRGALQAQGSFQDDGTGARRLDVTGTGTDLSFGQAQVDGALAGETRLTVQGAERNGVFAIQTARIENPRLNMQAEGQVGANATDLRATLRADDLRFLGRGFRGAVNANAQLRDAQGGRQITANGTADGLGIGNARADGILAGRSTFEVDARLSADNRITVNSLRAQNGQIRLTGNGSPTSGLNLDARLNDLALLVNGFPGPAEVRGTIRQTPQNYDVNLTATGPGGTRAQVTGGIAHSFASMDLRMAGNTQAAAANPFLRTRSVEGAVTFDLRVNGAPSLEALSGRVSLNGGRLAEPKLGLSIGTLNANADFNGGRVMVDVNGEVEAGGRITVNGPISLTGDRTMSLAVNMNRVILRDPNLYQVQVFGDITVTGSAVQGPLVAGRIDVREAELRIPSTGLGGATAIPDIRHLGERPPQRQTRAKAGLLEFPSEASRAAGMNGPPATPPANPARFDLVIRAPAQVFVRGRGVDAELGGELRVTGNARQPIPVGQLELIRGRVDLLGKRFDLTEGLIELQGSLIPVIRLVAETVQDGITTRIIIDGEARNPEIKFESSPDMPEEEVLSQLLFGRGLDRISALQAAQLASAVATLAGRGGEGIVGRLRASTGLDDLDLATDDQGNVSVRAGKYLSRNLYTDVQVGGDGKTRLNLNLDINPSLTARGSVSSEGDSTLGLFYERDY